MPERDQTKPSEPSLIQPARRPFLSARFRASFNLLFILVCLVYTSVELYGALFGHKEPTPEPPHPQQQTRFADRFKASMDAQVRQLGRVDPIQLGGTFQDSLLDYNCFWFVSCQKIDRPYQEVQLGNVKMRVEKYVEPPALLLHLGPIPVPTWHTISGTPRALRDMAVQVFTAGYWATAMFVSCAIFWVLLLVHFARTDQLIGAWMGLIFAPFAVSCCVFLVQHLCMGLMHLLGVVGAFLVIPVFSALPAGGLSVVINFKHLSGEQKELVEEMHRLKSL